MIDYAMFLCSTQRPDEGMERIVEISRVEMMERKGDLKNECTGKSHIEMIDCGVWEEKRMNTGQG